MATKFTIRRNGIIMGTYPAPSGDENEAFDALAKDEGFANFKEACAKKKLTRDDHKCEPVEEG